MSAEIKVTADVVFRRSGRVGGVEDGPLSVTMTGTATLEAVQTIGTSEEALALADVPAGGWCRLKNMDDTNYVQVKGASGATPFGRMRPGEPMLFRIDPGATIYLQANTAACKVSVVLMEA